MKKTASQIQKERIKELEAEIAALKKALASN